MTPRLRQAGRALALVATALALAATSIAPCVHEDSGQFDAATTCGPPGPVTLSFQGASREGCSAGCWGFLQAPGAGAVGLPEQGEINPGRYPPGYAGAPLAPGTAIAVNDFALVGDAPVAGAAPAVVRRTCRASPSATPGMLDLTCGGDEPAAACAGTLTLRPAP